MSKVNPQSSIKFWTDEADRAAAIATSKLTTEWASRGGAKNSKFVEAVAEAVEAIWVDRKASLFDIYTEQLNRRIRPSTLHRTQVRQAAKDFFDRAERRAVGYQGNGFIYRSMITEAARRADAAVSEHFRRPGDKDLFARFPHAYAAVTFALGLIVTTAVEAIGSKLLGQ